MGFFYRTLRFKKLFYFSPFRPFSSLFLLGWLRTVLSLCTCLTVNRRRWRRGSWRKGRKSGTRPRYTYSYVCNGPRNETITEFTSSTFGSFSSLKTLNYPSFSGSSKSKLVTCSKPRLSHFFYRFCNLINCFLYRYRYLFFIDVKGKLFFNFPHVREVIVNYSHITNHRSVIFLRSLWKL